MDNPFKPKQQGTSALTIMHDFVNLIDSSAPRMDEIGKQAIARLASKVDLNVPDNDQQQVITKASDWITNSLVGLVNGSEDNVYLRGAALGLTAGVGAVLLPAGMGAQAYGAAHSNKKKLFTIGLYVVGGIIAALVSKKMQEGNNYY